MFDRPGISPINEVVTVCGLTAVADRWDFDFLLNRKAVLRICTCQLIWAGLVPHCLRIVQHRRIIIGEVSVDCGETPRAGSPTCTV